MNTYLVLLLVTEEQEQAIKFLYEQRGWKYLKTYSKTAVNGELETLHENLWSDLRKDAVFRNQHPQIDYLENSTEQQFPSVVPLSRNPTVPQSVYDLSTTNQQYSGLDSTSVFSGGIDLHVTPTSTAQGSCFESSRTTDSMTCISKSLIILDNMDCSHYTDSADVVDDSVGSSFCSVTTDCNIIQTQCLSSKQWQNTIESTPLATPATKTVCEETSPESNAGEYQTHVPHAILPRPFDKHNYNRVKARNSKTEYAVSKLQSTQHFNDSKRVDFKLLNGVARSAKDTLQNIKDQIGRNVNIEETQNTVSNVILKKIEKNKYKCDTDTLQNSKTIEIVDANEETESVEQCAQDNSLGSLEKNETSPGDFPSKLEQSEKLLANGTEIDECFVKHIEHGSITSEEDIQMNTDKITVNNERKHGSSTLQQIHSNLSGNDSKAGVDKDNSIAKRNDTAKNRKYHWAVNRNIRIHKCHHKCRQIPPDVDMNNYSVEVKGYFCFDCNYVFNTKTQLKLHKQIKGGHCSSDCIYCDKDNFKETFDCPKCPKSFKSGENLKRHMENHSIGFQCHFCGDSFYTAPDLKAHLQSFHPEESQVIYLCDLCGSQFNEKKVMNAHRKYVHTEERPEVCPTCGSKFKTKSQLKNHLVCHKKLDELNLSCEICGKMFHRVSTLKDHVRRHNKDFSLFCSVCSKGFYKSFDLREHMRSHTGIKPFECKICTYKCSLRCNLLKHKRIHLK